MRLDAAEVIGRDIGVGEHRLAQRAHETQLVARSRVGGDAAKRCEIGNHGIRFKHHPFVDFIDVAAMTDPGIRRRDLQIARRKRDEAGLPRQCCLEVEHFARIREEHFRSGEIDFLCHREFMRFVRKRFPTLTRGLSQRQVPRACGVARRTDR